MTEQIKIQRFPFKTIGSAEAASANTAAGFQYLPYKTKPAANEAAGNTVEQAEKLKELVISEKDIAESKQKSFEEGYAKGYSGAKTEQAELDKKIQENLDDITIKLIALGEVIKTRNNAHIKELAEVVLRVAKKVAGDALKNAPYDEIENTIRSCLPLLFDEPKISIFVNPDLVDNIKERITPLVQNAGFRNNIEISGSAELSAGSCNIEWNGGGLRNDKDVIWSRIEELCGGL